MTSLRDKANLNSSNKKLQFCPYCGAKLIDGARFCPACGEEIINVAQDDSTFNQTEQEDMNFGGYSYNPNFQTNRDKGTSGNASTSQKTHRRKAVNEREIYKCPNCGEILDPTATRCPACGYEIRDAKDVSNSRERKVVYEGNIHKCPNCGEVLDSFVTRCPACGYEIRDARNTMSVEELSRKLAQISNKKTKRGLFSKLDEDSEKASLIMSFAIPNTKEDILEFVILAAANIRPIRHYGNYNYDQVSQAWIAKLEQAYQKAEASMKDQPEFIQIKNIYNKKMNQIRREKMFYPVFIATMIGVMILGFGFLFTIGNDGIPVLLIVGVLYLIVVAVVVLFYLKRTRKQ